MKYLIILLLSSLNEDYHTIKIKRVPNLTCSEQALIWINDNATHYWEINNNPQLQGFYLNRTGKKELMFGYYCDNT
jgi:hypothetical protein